MDGNSPSRQTSQEGESAGGDLQPRGHGTLTDGDVPILARLEDEAHEEAEEYGDEDHVGAQRADQV